MRLRQINVDYAVCQSLNSMESGCQVVTIYDVACQWSRNFRRRVEASKYLDFPLGMELVPAVGKWHLGVIAVVVCDYFITRRSYFFLFLSYFFSFSFLTFLILFHMTKEKTSIHGAHQEH